ncbi:MAG: hypothetical protein IKA09_04550 [Lachnospiraceae bacterium]|nr:hypothetical protein [Lachnospiraceae bacterium]
MKAHKSLFASIISLLLCVTMFLGTTLAWFTDTVTITNNRIKNGTLDVELWMDKAWDGNYVDISGSEDGDIFSEAKDGKSVKWEPGKTEIVFLAVANKGKLALNYNIIIDVKDLDTGDNVDPARALEYAIIDGWKAEDYKAAEVNGWSDYEKLQMVQTGSLASGKSVAAEKGALTKDGVDYFALAVHMDEEAGREYMGKGLGIDVQINAKQMASEYDSITNQYDANATYNDDMWNLPNYVNVYANDFETEAEKNWTIGSVELAASFLVSDVASRVTGEKPENFYITKDDAKSGSGYFRMKSGYHWAGYYFAQNASPFVSGKEYTLTALVRIDKDDAGKLPLDPYFRLEFQDSAKTMQYFYFNKDTANGATVNEENAGEWVELSWTFTAPEGADKPTSKQKLTVYKSWTEEENANKTRGYGVVEVDNIRISYEAEPGEESSVTELAKFRNMLAQEAAVSQMVQQATLEDEGERTPIPGTTNLSSDSGFSNPTLNQEGTSSWFAKPDFVSSGEWAEDSHTNDGSGSLKLTYNGTNGNPWYYQMVDDVKTDVVYHLSFWYKIPEENTKGKPVVKIETYADQSIPGAPADPYDQPQHQPSAGYVRDGEWHQVTYNFVVSDNTYSIKLLPRLVGSGTIYLDDIELYMTPPVDVVSLETEHKFFYDDELTDTTFKASFVGEYFPQYATGTTADFQVYDGENLIWESTGNQFNENVATAVFPLSTLQKKAVPYCVKVTLRGADGSEIDADSETIFVYPRPEYMTSDGIYLVNGKDTFNAVFGYHVTGTDNIYENIDEVYQKVAEAGINVVQLRTVITSDLVIKQLDACQKAGIMGLVTLYVNGYEAGDEINQQYTINVLSDGRVANHPANYGYAICDEPFLRDANAHRDMENSYRLVRQYDTKHPIFSVEGHLVNMGKTMRYTDIFIGDFYKPAHYHSVYNFTSQALEMRNGRPVYTLVQTYSEPSKGVYLPSGSEAVNNAWQVLLAGGTGVGYFSITDGVDLDKFNREPSLDQSKAIWEADDGGDLWNALVDFGTNARELAFDHFVYDKSPAFNEKLDGNAKYWYSSWVVDGSVYMVVLGMMKDESVQASIPLTSTNNAVSIPSGTVELISGDNTAATISNGNLTLEVNGVDVMLYKITPDTAVDFSSLN